MLYVPIRLPLEPTEVKREFICLFFLRASEILAAYYLNRWIAQNPLEIRVDYISLSDL
jgi:hypothetical protein